MTVLAIQPSVNVRTDDNRAINDDSCPTAGGRVGESGRTCRLRGGGFRAKSRVRRGV